MSQAPALPPVGGVFYPESDGKPTADNTRQFRWISVLQGNIAALYRDDPTVFVAGDLLWYAEEGDPEEQKGPDVMVVFGRPKGDRGSYRQWEEDNIPPQVVFEVLTPTNTAFEMADKFAFYDEHGIEEYYVYDPEHNHLQAFFRKGEVFVRQRQVDGLVSPRLGIRFDLSGPEMEVFYRNGRRFLTFEEIAHARQEAEQRAEKAEQRAEKAEQRAEKAEQRAARLVALSRKARQGQATPEELAELERLENEAGPLS
jgi:Uma2 family endonuclease